MSAHGTTRPFPFTAVVGNPDLKRSLLLNAVDPRIGGVLIRGDRGTAKTTIVRALAEVLPPLRTRAGCPVVCDPEEGPCTFCGDAGAIVGRPPRIVELPLGATEDRVVGTLDLEHALQSGQRRFEPGLLAAAHRGVLYIDEVNLLPDHLVDLLLDVAASGVNVVEREGNSTTHPARFLLIGTMNPEEGELRPQLLDRFGLVVEARTPTDPELRAEVIRRRIAFDATPAAFSARFENEQRALAATIVHARRALTAVQVPESMLHLAVDLCLEARTDGLRADITLYRAAAALAAIEGRDCVIEADVFEAALLALPHRQRRSSLDEPGQAPSVGEIVAARRPPPSIEGDGPADAMEPASPPPSPRGPTPGDAAGSPPSKARGTPEDAGTGGSPREPAPDRLTPPQDALEIPLPRAVRAAGGAAGLPSGRHGRQSGSRGRAFAHQPWDGRSHDIARLPTAIAAVLRPALAGSARRVQPEDLKMYRRRGPGRRLVLLAIDGSGSMGAQERMARTKGALLGILERIRQQRDLVAVQVFRDDRTELLLGPTRNIDAARHAIAALPTGGRTPLAHGIRSAAALLSRQQQRSPSAQSSLLVLVTDGRTREPALDAARAATAVVTDALVIDTETGPVRLRLAAGIARALRARYEVLP